MNSRLLDYALHFLAVKKTKVALIIALPLPLVKFIETYIFNAWELLAFICIAVFADTILGFYKCFKYKIISSGGFGRVLEKIVVYAVILVIAHAFKMVSQDSWGELILGNTGYILERFVFVREAISVLENLEAIRPNTLPKFLIKRLKDFDENGNYLGGSRHTNP